MADQKHKLPAYLQDDEAPEFGRPQGEADAALEAEGEDMMSDEQQDDTAAREAQLQTLGGMLDKRFTDTEQKRTRIEDRWLEDLRQYHGRYDPGVESILIESESCSLFLNITKPKTHAFSARVMDMVLPTDEKNWGIEPTPVPEIAGLDATGDKQAMAPAGGAMGQDGTAMPDQGTPDVAPDQMNPAAPGPTGVAPQAPGQPMTPGAPAGAPAQNPDGTMAPVSTPEGHPVLEKDIVKAVMDEAKARSEKMEAEIDDQLTEAKYNAHQRKAIEQMSKLGAGILMGPVITDEWRVQWKPEKDPNTDKNVWKRKMVPNTDKRAGVQFVDCWNFYPDMSANDPSEWEFAFVQYLINASTMRKYAKRYNFMEEQVRQVLEGTAPFNVRALRWMNELQAMSETHNIVDNRYRLLRYYGELQYDDLKAAGLDPEGMGLSEDDHLCGVVWLCNGTVLKVSLNPLDSYEMPFSVAYCDKDEASPFGVGIPRLMRGEQESVNAAWRMKHDNAGLSVCPQTVIKLNAVTPADGDYHMKPKKVWYVGDDVQNVNDVFAQFSIDSHQEELDNILQLGIRFADDVTQLPLLMQGDQAPHITQTAQGMSLLYNASTVVLRRTVKFYDDFMTEPMITRFFEWNMQFNPRDDIKGDFRCVALGSSTLLDKEQQGQALDVAMQLAMQPTWQPFIDLKKLVKQAMKIKRIQDVILPDDKIEENLKAQAEQAAAMAQAAQKPEAAGPAGMDPAQQAIEQAKLQVKREEIASRDRQIESNERIAAARMAHDMGISEQDAAARIAAIKINKSADIEMFNAELATKARVGSGI